MNYAEYETPEWFQFAIESQEYWELEQERAAAYRSLAPFASRLPEISEWQKFIAPLPTSEDLAVYSRAIGYGMVA